MASRLSPAEGAQVEEELRKFLAHPPPVPPGSALEPAEVALPGLLAELNSDDVAFVFSRRPLSQQVPLPVAVTALALQTYARRGAVDEASPPRLGCVVPVSPSGFVLLQEAAGVYRSAKAPTPAVFAGFLAWQVPPVELLALVGRCPPLAAVPGRVLPREGWELPPRVQGVAAVAGLLLLGVAAFAGTVALVARAG